MRKKKNATKALVGIEKLTAYSIKRRDEELVFFLVKPINISVLSESTVAGKISALSNVLKSLPELEILCLSSKENFDGNKDYLKSRVREEDNPTLRGLLAQDLTALDKMQLEMATAREFICLLRLKNEKDSDVYAYLSRIEKLIRDRGFTVRRATKADYVRILSVYFEQNVTSDSFDDFDGESFAAL
ncbi:MAG: hypothetical protein RSD32_07735 [Oscillospiraceae bacterium]